MTGTVFQDLEVLISLPILNGSRRLHRLSLLPPEAQVLLSESGRRRITASVPQDSFGDVDTAKGTAVGKTLPRPRIGHAEPRLLGLERRALLQELDGDAVG